ncbi:MAG: NAD(P)-dependent glycerol-3-phosphate dehydrogenase [Gemmatimonadetes bacterium]|nr:NAD(P)-dependent glycerol-3-phosphate dehydrogenase [Gemmatimonadota bacterium]
MTRVVVVGAGAWGTALANHCAMHGHATTLWAREPDVVEGVSGRHENGRFLAGIALDERLRADGDMTGAVRGAAIAILAPPSHALRVVARSMAGALAPGAIVVVATKGIEPDTLMLMTDVAAAELPGHPVVALSGPSFALEVARHQPTAIVAACAAAAAARAVQELLSEKLFRVYTQHDVTGVELGGALKNVMAVATGIAEGLGLGFNSRAALITRGLAEMTRLGVALGAEPATFAGLAGMGDLVLTCTGSLSRNRAVGMEIGAGKSLAQALEGKETVAEGVLTTRSAHALALRERVDMPIVATAHRVLFDGYPPRDAIRDLMTRELRTETDA